MIGWHYGKVGSMGNKNWPTAFTCSSTTDLPVFYYHWWQPLIEALFWSQNGCFSVFPSFSSTRTVTTFLALPRPQQLRGSGWRRLPQKMKRCLRMTQIYLLTFPQLNPKSQRRRRKQRRRKGFSRVMLVRSLWNLFSLPCLSLLCLFVSLCLSLPPSAQTSIHNQ